MPAAFEPDMQAWLRSHGAVILPILIAGSTVNATGRGLSFAHATSVVAAMDEALALVERLGHRVIPPGVATIRKIPRPTRAAGLWVAWRCSPASRPC